MATRRQGISNRETAEEEAQEREAHPPLDTSSPPPEDAAGDVGEHGADREGRQTSHKTGSRSLAFKKARARYLDRGMPATHKVAGAFGKEPGAVPAPERNGRQAGSRKTASLATPAGNGRRRAR